MASTHIGEYRDSRHLELSTVGGVVFAFLMVIIAISINSSISAYIDFPSILIVIGGTMALTAACYSFSEMVKAQGLLLKTIFHTTGDLKEEAEKVLELADTARKTGILSLQNRIASGNLPEFLEKGLAHIVDGMPAEQVEKIMNMEISSTVERHKRGAAILRKSAEIAPGMGLIGTLLGLVQMLGNLQDPSTIGPAMAVALLTTLYGAMLSFMLFTPVATKLERNSKEEHMLNTIFAKGVISIASSESPRTLEALFNTILPPSKRVQFFT